MQNKKIILAHRGYCQIAPENTKLAFDAAHIFGFDGLEMDVHMTKDGVPVVIHDETVDRTSDGKGKVEDLTLDEIRKLNFASEFNTAFPKQTIMTFEEFLVEYHDKFDVLNVEVKTDIIQYENLEQKLLDIHKKVNPKARIIYSAFNFKSLEIMRSLNKEVELGFLFVDSKDLAPIEEKVKEICNYLNPWFKSLAKPKEIAIYESYKLPMILWTIDERPGQGIWVDGSSQMVSEFNKNANIYSLICNSKF